MMYKVKITNFATHSRRTSLTPTCWHARVPAYFPITLRARQNPNRWWSSTHSQVRTERVQTWQRTDAAAWASWLQQPPQTDWCWPLSPTWGEPAETLATGSGSKMPWCRLVTIWKGRGLRSASRVPCWSYESRTVFSTLTRALSQRVTNKYHRKHT